MANIIVIGFGKSATTTLQKALASCSFNAYHQNVRDARMTVPELLYKSYKESSDPYKLFRRYEPFAITQMEYMNPAKGLVSWPQFDYKMLVDGYYQSDDIHYILNYRDPRALVDSMIRWKNGEFIQRLTNAEVPGLPSGVGENQNDIYQWIIGHYDQCRNLFGSMNRFLEVDIDSTYFRQTVEEFVGVTFEWWGKANQNVL